MDQMGGRRAVSTLEAMTNSQQSTGSNSTALSQANSAGHSPMRLERFTSPTISVGVYADIRTVVTFALFPEQDHARLLYGSAVGPGPRARHRMVEKRCRLRSRYGLWTDRWPVCPHCPVPRCSRCRWSRSNLSLPPPPYALTCLGRFDEMFRDLGQASSGRFGQ